LLVGLVFEVLILYPKNYLTGWAALVILFRLIYLLAGLGA